jgi:hypothetical protein
MTLKRSTASGAGEILPESPDPPVAMGDALTGPGGRRNSGGRKAAAVFAFYKEKAPVLGPCIKSPPFVA